MNNRDRKRVGGAPTLRVTCALFLTAQFLGAPALAQDKVEAVTENVDEQVKKSKDTPEEARKDGWSATVNLGATGSLLQNYQWVGQDDGLTLSAGGVAGATFDGVFGNHEWRNTGSYELQLLRTPAIDAFLKSADNLDLKTLYLYRIPFARWVGPFARARALTPIFPGFGVPIEDRYLRFLAPDGTEQSVRFQEGQKPFDLTGWFEPLTVSESAGAFIEPLSEKWLTTNFKGGLGAQHLFAYGGYVVTDDEATPELELRQLRMVHSAGAEVEADLSGALFDSLSYSFIASLYYPVLISVETDLDFIEVTHLEVEGRLSYKLSDWIGVDYVVRLRRQPFILNDWQIQNQVLLTTSFNLL